MRRKGLHLAWRQAGRGGPEGQGAAHDGRFRAGQGVRGCTRMQWAGHAERGKRRLALIYLVRHGETVWNREGRFQGQTDVELSQRGQTQGDRVAERLSTENLDVIVASDLIRAKETAEKVARLAQCPIELDPALREMHFGVWQGYTRDEIQNRFDAAFTKYMTDALDGRPTEGETFREVMVRVTAAVKRVVAAYPDGRIAIVAHGGSVRATLCHYLGWDPRHRGVYRLDNCSISLLEVRPEFVSLHHLNDCCHLTNEPAQPGKSQGGDAF